MSREAILQVASKLFIRHGYHGVTTRMLAQETGLSVGTIYHHFTDKKHLFYETLAFYVQKDPLLASGVSSIEELFMYLIAHHSYYQNQTRLFMETRQLYSRIEEALQDPMFLEVRDQLLTTYLGWLTRFISSMYPAIPKSRVEVVAQVIFHSSAGIFQASLFNPSIKLKDLLSTALDVATTYLAKLNEQFEKNSNFK